MNNYKLIIYKCCTIALMIMLAAACTQDRPYDAIIKFDEQSKDTLGINPETGKAEEVYALTISNVGADMEAAAIPFETSSVYLVKPVFTEDSLQFKTIVEDDRFQGELNQKIAISIPVDHIDYKCAEDADNKCTNREESNNDISWNEKRFFKPRFGDIQSHFPLGLSVDTSKFFSGCYSKKSSELNTLTLNKDIINIKISNSYTTSANCTNTYFLNSFSELGFRVSRMISITKLSNLASKSYLAKKVDLKDPTNAFGFFQDFQKILDESNLQTQTSNVRLVKRWNPEKKIIPFYLSESFNEDDVANPGMNAALKKATYLSVDRINSALEEAKANFKLELKEPSKEAQAGDIRYNHIVMVPDPIKRGLLGYGPSLSNPLTGEILKAQTVMYKGIMKMTAGRAYNDGVKLMLEKAKVAEKTIKASASSNDSDASSVVVDIQGQERQVSLFNSPSESVKAQFMREISSTISSPTTNASYDSLMETPFLNNLVADLMQGTSQYDVLLKDQLILKQESLFKEVLSKNNFYLSDFFDSHGAAEKAIEDLVKEFGLKPWEQLTAKQRTHAIDVLVPIVWVPTLVHEIGHNLGLRHNFYGSFDKDNFYTKEELAEMKITNEIKYSSIMDYAHDTSHELSLMGKYDIAALRSAYGQQTATAIEDGSEKKMTGLLELVKAEDIKIAANNSLEMAQLMAQGYSLKPYKYCSDEHVGSNPTCNRFDEGTSYLEVVQHYKKSYEENYHLSNYRNNRYRFDNFFGDVSYTVRLLGMMGTMRDMFELHETFTRKYGLAANDERWESIAFLKDIKQATIESGKFLVDIIKTPATHCLLQQVDSQQYFIMGLSQISKLTFSDYTSCYEMDLGSNFLVLGQAGKSFNSVKAANNPDGSIIEIDVRGVWLDKLIATKMLLERNNSAIDNYHGNYLNMPELTQEIVTAVTGIMKDSLTVDLKFDIGATIPYKVSFFDDESHKINQHLHSGIRYFLGLPAHTVDYQSALLNLVAEAKPLVQDEIGEAFTDAFSIGTSDDGRTPKKSLKIQIGDNYFYATSRNLLASYSIKAIRQLPGITAFITEYMKVPADVPAEEAAQWQADRQTALVEILNLRTASNDQAKAPADASKEEKEIYKLDLELTTDFVSGSTKDANYYEMLITSMK
ncbi:zinc-dependent metalloprotease [bacterium]|nr:zinc-dependent metalloprotease [bacterium]